MSEQECTCDLLIVGAGPAGCTAALYGARAGLATVMLSPSEVAGMMAVAPVVGNFPAQTPPASGRDILEIIRRQALDAGAEHLLEAAIGVDFRGEHKVVFAGPEPHVAPAVIIATGAMAASKKAPGEAEFQGRGVCYCAACDGPLYRDQDVLVVGQDDQAVEEALALSGVARSVCLAMPAPEPAIADHLREAVEAGESITVEAGLRLKEIVGSDEGVTGAVFSDRAGQERAIEAAGVFMYLRGAAPATEFLYGAVETDEKGFIITDEQCQTSVPGVFAAGDVRSKQARQMVIACGEGATAALAAERLIRGRAAVRQDRGEASREGA